MGSARVENPQSWNRYTYTHNNPINLVDVLGLYVWGTGANDDTKKKFRAWLADTRRARDGYDSKSKEYKKLNAILQLYGKENQVGVTIRFDTKSSTGAALDTNTRAHAETNNFRIAGGRMVANHEVTFNVDRLSEVSAETVAHEGQHLVDNKALVSSFHGSKGHWVPGLAENRTEYQREDRAFEAGQFVDRGLRRNSIRFVEGGAPSALYLNSWAEQDAKTLEATMGRARADYIQRAYGLSEKSPGKKAVP